MKPNILLYDALMMRNEELDRCFTDVPRAVERPSALRRWSSKLKVAVPSSVRFFRRTVREPLEPRMPPGTLVRTSEGRNLGRVREVVVALPSGRASYAVHDARTEDARVLLIPRDAVHAAGAHAVVEDRVLEGAARSA
jgi:sporulation protein YlmC with PRC-barrel domain